MADSFTNFDDNVVVAPDNVGEMLCAVMESIALRNYSYGAVPTSPFTSPFAPSLPLQAYMSRLREFMYCSNECFIIASLLITRLEESFGNQMVITPTSSHRILLTALVVAAKCHDDRYLDNRHYSEVGGVSLSELNRLELALLEQLEYRVFVSPSEYSLCLSSLESLYKVTKMTQPPSPDSMTRLRRSSSVKVVEIVLRQADNFPTDSPTTAARKRSIGSSEKALDVESDVENWLCKRERRSSCISVCSAS